MKRRKISLIIIHLLLYHAIFAQTPVNDSHWQLKWQDDFNTFNTNRWIKVHNCDHDGAYQLFRNQNIWTANGNLVIEVNNTKATCLNPDPDHPSSWCCGSCTAGTQFNYTGGWVETQNEYSTRFGYIEARIKFPFRRENNKSWGFGYGFWAWRYDGEASNVAEIDPMELFGGDFKQPNSFNTSVHTCYGASTCSKNMFLTLTDFDYRDWHTYAIEWNSNRMIWYVDGKAVRTLSNHGIIDPVRIILSLGVQREKNKLPPTSPSWAEYMYVDYVKVYCLKCDKNTPLIINDLTDLATYDNKVKKSITINPITIPAGSKITLRANDYIELKPGFEAQAGREFYLDVSPCETCVPIAEQTTRKGGDE